MTMEFNPGPQVHLHQKQVRVKNVSSGIYGLAFIGALVFYLQHAATFWEGVLGILKAIVWPAILAYQLLAFLSK